MATVVPTADEGLAHALSTGLAQVEALLQANLAHADAFIDTTASHLFRAGGKRFRPQLALLAAQFGDPHAAGVLEVAAVVELTHLATLYHDDVMDEAVLRRGRPSANARFGNSVAILTGDFLLARASLLLSKQSHELIEIQAATMERLVVGQMQETRGPGPADDPVQYYLQVAADKTASLIAASAHLGAVAAGASRQVAETLTQFGERIGLAFQLADDLLDIVSDSPQWGKTPGTDLREGVASFPLVLARQPFSDAQLSPQWGAAQAQELQQLLDADLSDQGLHGRALELLRLSPAVCQTQALMQEQAAQAQMLLADLPQNRATAALEQLCQQVVTRRS